MKRLGLLRKIGFCLPRSELALFDMTCERTIIAAEIVFSVGKSVALLSFSL